MRLPKLEWIHKFLGISIDNKKIALQQNVLYEQSFTTIKMVEHSLIEAHLRYGIVFWSFCIQQLFLSVFEPQKRAIKYLCRVGVRES